MLIFMVSNNNVTLNNMVTEYRQKTYGWKELAILYAPGLTPHSASKRLTRWVVINEALFRDLIRSGWIKGSRVVSPLQVGIIMKYLGEPG